MHKIFFVNPVPVYKFGFYYVTLCQFNSILKTLKLLYIFGLSGVCLKGEITLLCEIFIVSEISTCSMEVLIKLSDKEMFNSICVNVNFLCSSKTNHVTAVLKHTQKGTTLQTCSSYSSLL